MKNFIQGISVLFGIGVIGTVANSDSSSFSRILRRIPGLSATVHSSEISPEEHPTIFVESKELKFVGFVGFGHHQSDIVEDSKSGTKHVRKKGQSFAEIEKEFMVANFLNKVNEIHPPCHLEIEDNGKVNTLSTKHDNTQNFEEFVRAGKSYLLLTKKLVGLEDTLIASAVVGKQSDNKLANIVIREEEDTLYFSSIDNERAHLPYSAWKNLGDIECPTSSSRLVEAIYDMQHPSEENRAGLAGDTRAKELGEILKEVVDQDKIIEAYARIVTADLDELRTKCVSLSTKGTFFSGKASCEDWIDHFSMIQSESAKVVSPSRRNRVA